MAWCFLEVGRLVDSPSALHAGLIAMTDRPSCRVGLELTSPSAQTAVHDEQNDVWEKPSAYYAVVYLVERDIVTISSSSGAC